MIEETEEEKVFFEIKKIVEKYLAEITPVISRKITDYLLNKTAKKTKGAFMVSDLSGEKTFFYKYMAVLDVPYKFKDDFKDLCKSYNKQRKDNKYPVHFEFKKEMGGWVIYTDEQYILNGIINITIEKFEAELIKKEA